MSRREELAGGLAAVRRRITAAETAAGRPPGSVHLVVVTKFFPASDVRLLAELGVTDVGENRHQEARAKAYDCADLDLCWHFIGGLQTNKAAAVAKYADVVESVDRIDLLPRLARGAAESGRQLAILLQVSLEAEAEGRSGAEMTDLHKLAEAAAAAGVEVRGLMAVAPRGEDPVAAFDRLAAVRTEFLKNHPEATVLSAGMSADLESAIAAGATHVRVGSAILGSR